MQADVTKQTFGAVILQFVLFAALFWSAALLGDRGYTVAADNIFIPGELLNRYGAAVPWAGLTVTLALVFVIAFILTRTLSRNLVYPTRTYLTCIFYLLISCGIIFPAYDIASVLAAYLMACATVAFISSFVRTFSFGFTFRGAFLIGITPLLAPQNAVYLLLVPVAMLVFRRNARESAVAVTGSLLPSFFAAYIYWVLGYGFTGVYGSIWEGLVTPVDSCYPIPSGIGFTARIVSGVFTAALIIVSAVSFLTMATDIRPRAYKVQVFAFWFLIIASASLALPSRSPAGLTVLAIPAAIIAPAFFVRFRGAVPAAIYILFCSVIAVSNLLSFL